MPANVISFPGTTCCGSFIHASSVSSFQTMFDFFKAGEYRVKLATLPAFLFQRLARLGPVIFRSGCKEWQAAQAPNTRWPRVGFAFCAYTKVPTAMRKAAPNVMAARGGESVFMERTP